MKKGNKFTAIFKSAGSLVWFIVTVFLVALLITLTILENGLLEPIIQTVLGGPMPIQGDNALEIYKSDYDSKEKSVEAGNKLNVTIGEEGFTLLLNENGTLPLSTSSDNKAKVSVFGHNSVDLVLGGSGSGGISGVTAKTIYDGLEKANFEYNPKLKEFYESSDAGAKRSENPELSDSSSAAPTLDIGETPAANYRQRPDVMASFAEYSAAAIVVISRLGGESFDVPRTQNTQAGGIAGNHYLQLDKNEYDMLDMVTARFKKVIVVLNTLTSFQCDFIDRYNNTDAADKRIDAVLWIGGPGATAAEAIGDILAGNVNPSGRTVDIYARDFTKDPTWVNFGDGSQTTENGAENTSFMQNGAGIAGYNIVTYEEGVYLGYRYYETRGFEEGGSWYNDNVVFPFGHGLSYSKFSQELEVSGSLEKGEKVAATVTVTNISNKTGKDVVELYVNRPYYSGGIEKPYVSLVDFAKTDDLLPGAHQTFTFTIDPYDLASYDYNNAAGDADGFKGYKLEAGDYAFIISSNSHVDENAYATKVVKLETGYRFEKDPVTDYPVTNLYTDVGYDSSDYKLTTVRVGADQVERKGMSRTDFEGTFPTKLTEADRTVNQQDALAGWNGVELTELAKLRSLAPNNTRVAEQAAEMPTTGAAVQYKLRDLVDMEEGSPTFGKVDYDDTRWSDLLDSLTFEDMKKLVNNGAFQTSAIESIGKNLTNDSDGPIGFVNFMPGKSDSYKNNTTFACEIVIGSTWNKDLAYQMGKIVGENGLWGDTNGNHLSYTGWYAPAVNLHRSPFSGRNFEYYSEDPILSGKMAVNVINAAATKGVYSDLKHFAVNDQETNRAGVSTFLTEQSLRELYLKPFEMAVKGNDDPSLVPTASVKDHITEYTGTIGIMSSFNRLGNTWTGGDYRLMTEILRYEWGFRGLVICDYKTDNSYMDAKQMLYAGNDLILASLTSLMWENPNPASKEDVYILRQSSKNILYTVANSNSVQIDIVGYRMEWWRILTIVLDCVIPVGLAVWGFFAIRKAWKKDAARAEASANADSTPVTGGDGGAGGDGDVKEPEGDKTEPVPDEPEKPAEEAEPEEKKEPGEEEPKAESDGE